MDKELNNIADDIIKDSFSSGVPEPSIESVPESAPAPEVAPAAPEVAPAPAPSAAPQDTFTADIPQPASAPQPEPAPQPAPAPRPTMPMANSPRPRTDNEYSRIKEQMSAAREASGISGLNEAAENPQNFNSKPVKEHGLNKAILLFIIFIPVLAVSAGVLVMVLNMPSNNGSDSNPTPTVKYEDPRDTAEVIDLSIATGEIQIENEGHYILTGTTKFPVKVKAPGEVTLYLNNVSITATGASAIANYSENPLIIFLDNDTESTLAVTEPETFDSIYSEGDLIIDGGTGILNVAGIKIAGDHHYDVTGNGIKDSKSGTAIVSEPTEETQPEASGEPVAQPAEGESGFQEGTQPPVESSQGSSTSN